MKVNAMGPSQSFFHTEYEIWIFKKKQHSGGLPPPIPPVYDSRGKSLIGAYQWKS
jgi:hypothetical protein